MSSPSKRREMDVMKLMMSDYNVETINDGLNEFNVEFHGPKESLYEGGVWKIRVELPDAYPYKSPSIGFVNKIYHPNVDEMSGSVCLDVINQSWSPMFDLLNVFEVFLPQLLLYPNPSDPLNGDAASLMMKDRKQYDQKVKGYVRLPHLLFTEMSSRSRDILLKMLNRNEVSREFHCLDNLHSEILARFYTITGSAFFIRLWVVDTEYCERYAKKEHISNSGAEEDSDDEEISIEGSESSDDDDEIAGHADP